MNLIDAKVTKVLGVPEHREHEDQQWWQVEVDYVDDGGHSEKSAILQFKTEAEAAAVKPDYVFQH